MGHFFQPKKAGKPGSGFLFLLVSGGCFWFRKEVNPMVLRKMSCKTKCFGDFLMIMKNT